MTQNVLDYSQNPSGADLMDVFLAGMAENQLTNHSGVSRPSYAKAGTFWIDTSVSPWVLKQFTGSADISVGTLNQSTKVFVAQRALQDANGNNIANSYLRTNGTAAKATADANGNNIANSYLRTNGTAAKATADANGNNIANTYATKTELQQKSSFKLFHHDWFDYQLNDQSWLRADTFSWQSGTTYSNAYQHLVADYNGGTSQTETVGSYTITYYQATDGHKIVLANQETTVANIYNESGVAWYYILDTANQRFKLPRENPAREELLQVIRAKGNGKSLGLTNGTDDIIPTTYGSGLGYFSKGTQLNIGDTVTAVNPTALKAYGVDTNSTKSGIISSMTDSTSVYKGKKYLYFYIGQFSQSATEQTAGLNSSLFNGKADIDLSNAASNASASAKKIIDGWGMPDYSAITSYTPGNAVPSNGFVFITTYLYDKFPTISVNGVLVIDQGNGNYNCTTSLAVPVYTGDKVTHNGTLKSAYFVPCKGG